LDVHDTHGGLVIVHDEVTDEVLRIVVDNRIIPKFLYVRPVPRIGALESWNSVEGLFEELADLLVQTRYLHA
jgi:hypothetical protein